MPTHNDLRARAVRARSRTAASSVDRAAAGEPPERLAHEAIRAFRAELDAYHRTAGTRDETADPRAAPGADRLAAIEAKPPQEFTFGQFHMLAQADAERALARWNAVKAAARNDLETGWLASQAVDNPHSAWRRATFLAVRAGLAEALRPTDAAEALLVDEMAQYEVLRQVWLTMLTARTDAPSLHRELLCRQGPMSAEDRRTYSGTRLAHDEAMRMVERFQRLSHAAMRALLSLRRTGSRVVCHSAQVNVAIGPQMNVSPGIRPGEPAREDL